MKKKIIGIFVVVLLCATSILPTIGSKNIQTNEPPTVDMVDQVQDQQEEDVGFWHTEQYAQSFMPNYYVLSRVYLYLYVPIDYSTIRVSIFKNLAQDPAQNLTTTTVYAYDITPKNTWTWVEFNFPDIYVSQGSTYHIVVSSNDDDDVGIVHWGYSNQNPYDRGSAWYQHGLTAWESYGDGNIDFCFKTYGGNSKSRDVNNFFENFPILHWLLQKYPNLFSILKQISV